MFLKPLWVTTQAIVTTAGGIAGYLFGGIDGLIIALVAFVTADYLTGVMAAISEKRLSSAIGFKGIFRKIIIFTLVGLANVLDVHVLGDTGVLRTATIFFLHLQRRHQPAGERHPPRLAGACADS